ncbi:unnamed protein product [Moneuplotes crassus]|uniref:CS domain-containing protein n=1 Tax=Euplotes crassus TaxID=5936 RepID=A0AAD1XR18_EUPCR|nr:unnamed protein product [Moneuplotes crassus]
METASESFYIHLIPRDLGQIKESFKISVNTNEEGTVSKLYRDIYAYLETRNDGNKVYHINGIRNKKTGEDLPHDRFISSYFSPRSNDVYCMLDCSIDASKHVKPLESKPKEESKKQVRKSAEGVTQDEVDNILNSYDGKVKAITKYSWYEASNQKWIKAIISIDGIKDIPKEDIDVKFGERTVDIFVKNAGPNKNLIYHFGCRRTQKPVIAAECKWSLKSDGIQVSLKKKDKKDSWMSFYKEKVGDVDSEFEDDVIRQIKK